MNRQRSFILDEFGRPVQLSMARLCGGMISGPKHLAAIMAKTKPAVRANSFRTLDLDRKRRGEAKAP
jgi:hypothetical protein